MNGISFWGTEYEFHNPQIDTSYYQHMLMLNRLISILLYTWAAIKFDSGFCWPEYNVSRYSSSTENQWHMQGLHTPLCRCHNHRLHQTSTKKIHWAQLGVTTVHRKSLNEFLSLCTSHASTYTLRYQTYDLIFTCTKYEISMYIHAPCINYIHAQRSFKGAIANNQMHESRTFKPSVIEATCTHRELHNYMLLLQLE